MINATVKLNKNIVLAIGLTFVVVCLITFEFFYNIAHNNGIYLGQAEERINYINNLGYNINIENEQEQDILIPKKFPKELEEYNKKQQEQGFNLHNLEGKIIKRYTYNVTTDTIISLFVYKNILVGQDIIKN